MTETLDWVDTHCHLNDEKFAADTGEVIARAEKAGVRRMINMGDTPESSAWAARLAAGHEGLFAAVGIHPEAAREITTKEKEQLAAWAKSPKVVAIGEIGLDYYWEKVPENRLLQQKLFISQLDLARQLNLPVCIHNREAHEDTLKILKREGKGLRGVLHCFSGSLEMAEELWRMGFLIGADGPLTYKNAARLPAVVAACPHDMLLLETDAPYLSPVPHRGKRNEPSYVPLIGEKVAEIWGKEAAYVAAVTTANAERLYNI